MPIKRVEYDIDKSLFKKAIKDELGWYHEHYENNSLFLNHYQRHLTGDKTVAYQLNHDVADRIVSQMNDYHYAITATVMQLLKYADRKTLHRVFETTTLTNTQLDLLIDIAKTEIDKTVLTIQSETPKHAIDDMLDTSFYGRFDVPINEKGEIQGVYEFNSDTPVMLFESIVIQNCLSENLGKSEYQYNEFFHLAENINKHYNNPYKNKNVAVIYSVEHIDDVATSMMVGQLLETMGANVYIGDLTQLNHDLYDMDKPFFVDGASETPIDKAYVLLPWEEMLVGNVGILEHHKKWLDNFQFLEPAWRWFYNHKGFQAFVTECLEDSELVDETIKSNVKSFFKDVTHMHIPTYWDNSKFDGVTYVSKPAIGRFSSDVTIHHIDKPIDALTGFYKDEKRVYQRYTPTATNGEYRYMLGVWTFNRHVAGIAFRETSNELYEEDREEFVPHVLVDN